MFQPLLPLLLLLLSLVPAPADRRAQTPAVHPMAGAWALDWGHCEQTTFFRADGTCWSQEFGAGTWSEDPDGYVWFTEREGTLQYVMRVDLLDGGGSGWHVGGDGQFGNAVEVRIRRGERLPMPRAIE